MKTDRVSGLFWLTAGLSGLCGSLHLGCGSSREPGPGFLPFLSSAFISLLALALLVSSFLDRGDSPPLWQGLFWRRPLAIVILMSIYIVFFTRAGFLVSSFFFLLAVLVCVEHLSWGKALLVSALGSALSYGLFKVLLKVELPAGILGLLQG